MHMPLWLACKPTSTMQPSNVSHAQATLDAVLHGGGSVPGTTTTANHLNNHQPPNQPHSPHPSAPADDDTPSLGDDNPPPMHMQHMGGGQVAPGILAGTPADLILGLVHGLMEGRAPGQEELELVRSCVLGAEDIYRPLHLDTQLHGLTMDVSGCTLFWCAFWCAFG